jgi:nicotinamide mononucleotide transporter PnuC
MSKIKKLFSSLSIFERVLYIFSVTLVVLSFIISPEKSVLSLIASLIGVTALIFIAKGYVIGQVLIIIFALLYGVVSFIQGYYGEVLTYVGMSAPMAVVSMVSWVKNPYKGTKTVKVSKLRWYHLVIMAVLTVTVTFAFYFILGALGTSSLYVSTLSVATTFAAVYLTFLRSPYYAIGYLLNDIVLITLWVIASIKDPSRISMVICFAVFLVNDLNGFISWKRMEKRQRNNE